MKPSPRNLERSTVEALGDAWRAGTVDRRQFLHRAALLGVGAAAAGGLLQVAGSHPAAAQTRAELVGTSANSNISLANRITAIGRVISGQDARLASVLLPVNPPDMPPDALAALRNVLTVVASLATRMGPYLQISAPPQDWTGGTIPPPPDDDNP